LNTYFRQFWSLNLDFIERFKALRFKGVPLPFLIPFQVYTMNGALKQLVADPSLSAHLSVKLEQESEIGPAFAKYLRPPVPLQRIRDGKFVLYTPLLRFPGFIYESYFDPANTIVVHPENKPAGKFSGGHPIFPLSPYKKDAARYAPPFIETARKLFQLYRKHPIYGHPNFVKLLKHDIVRCIAAVLAAEKLFAQHRVACIIVGATNDPYSRALAWMAGRRGIPSVCMQHGTIGREEGFLPAFATKLAVHGKDEADWYLSKGVPLSRIAVTGHPRFDHIHTRQLPRRGQILEKLGIGKGRKSVLVVTNSVSDPKLWGRYITELARYRDITILIKPHRNEIKSGRYKDYGKYYPAAASVQIIANNDIKLHELIAAADAVALELSTVGLEAMLHRTPTVFLRREDYSHYNHRYYYQAMQPYVGTDSAQAARLTSMLVRSPRWKAMNLAAADRFLQHAYPVRMSGEAVHSLLRSLTGQSCKRKTARRFEGLLVKGPGRSVQVYYVRQGLKRHILSPSVFEKRGFSGRSVLQLSAEEIKQIPPGPMIR